MLPHTSLLPAVRKAVDPSLLSSGDTEVAIPMPPDKGQRVLLTVFLPTTFHNIRTLFNVDAADFESEWENLKNVQLSRTVGRSGSLFLKSRTEQLLLKVILGDEAKLIKRILPQYYHHLRNNPDSLLCRVFCMIRLQVDRLKRFVIVLANIADPRLTTEVKPRIYDLKGRVCKNGKFLENAGRDDIVYKDKDMNHYFFFPPATLQALRCQLVRDTTFLRAHDLMDYSLFIAVVAQPLTEYPPDKTRRSAFQQDCGGLRVNHPTPSIFYIGIIDMFTDYNAKKKVANFCKKFRWSASELSTVPAEYYATRFLSYLNLVLLQEGQTPHTAPYLVKDSTLIPLKTAMPAPPGTFGHQPIAPSFGQSPYSYMPASNAQPPPPQHLPLPTGHYIPPGSQPSPYLTNHAGFQHHPQSPPRAALPLGGPYSSPILPSPQPVSYVSYV